MPFFENKFLVFTFEKLKLPKVINVCFNQQQQDNMSDSSGEVTASDSGRGGSDLDLSMHLSKSGKHKNYKHLFCLYSPTAVTCIYTESCK